MPETMNGHPQAPEPSVPCVGLSRCLSHSVSADGATAALVFEMTDGDRLMLTIPAAGLRMFRSMLNNIIDGADRAGRPTGQVQFKHPQVFQVGHSDEYRGTVAISFDPNLAGEAIYLIRDKEAMQLSAMIRQDVVGRMSAADRAKLQTALVQAKPKLIVPRN